MYEAVVHAGGANDCGVEIVRVDSEDIEKNGPATTQEEADQRPVPSFEGTAASSLDDVSDALAMLALFGVELL